MLDESTQWQTKDNRESVFDLYTLIGVKFKNAVTSEVGWFITVRPTGNGLIHDYWVAVGDFYSITWHLSSQINLIKLSQPPITKDIDADERKTVLNAIADWENAPRD